MPIKSKQQQKAMYAAASGNSKVGIPKKVAKEYIKSTPKKAYKKMPRKVAIKRRSNSGGSY